MREAEINGEKVCIKGLRTYAQGNDDTIKKVRPSVIRHWGAPLKRLDRQKFYEEVVVWKRLQHPNIVPCLGVPTGRWPPFEIVCSWMENGKITDYVGKYPDVDRINLVSVFASTVTVSFRKLYLQLWDVVDGLHFLHSCKIIHGDLKGVSLISLLQLSGSRSLISMDSKANILVDGNGRARLTDFGLTSITRGDNSINSPQETSPASTTWAAPEVLESGNVTKEGDIFTVAMVSVEVRASRISASASQVHYLEQIFTGHSPFIKNYNSALYDIMSGKRPQRPGTLDHDKLWRFVQRCWDQDPSRRPTTSELLEFFRTS